MKLKVGIVLHAALAIELVNWFRRFRSNAHMLARVGILVPPRGIQRRPLPLLLFPRQIRDKV
ncbi:MAG TPA: hypothetical protein VHT24_03925, partial [Pseudacidobacterium sp.]|nr:hypothetical protein [Pseudacidobacterium sp.]